MVDEKIRLDVGINLRVKLRWFFWRGHEMKNVADGDFEYLLDV